MVGLMAGAVADAGVVTTPATPGSSDLEASKSRTSAILKYSFWSEMELEDDSSAGFDMQAISLQVPVMGNRSADFSWGVDLEGEYTYFNARNEPVIGDHDLYELGFNASFSWNNVGGSKWSPVLSVMPSIATDFDSVESEAFRLTAFAGAFYQQRSNLKWLLGVAYNDQGHEEHVFPIAGFSWQPSAVWDVTLLGPRLDVTYKMNDDWRFGAFADVYSRSWEVENFNEQQTLVVFSARAGLRVDYQAFANAWVFAEAGVSFANSVEVRDSEEVELFDDDAESGFFGSVGMRYNF